MGGTTGVNTHWKLPRGENQVSDIMRKRGHTESRNKDPIKIHFADNDHLPNQQGPGYKLYEVPMLITHFQQGFLRHYHPNHNFMSNKRGGACQTVKCRFEVYKGAAPRNQDANQHGPTHELVMRLMTEADLLNRGHHLCVDNYFSSPALFQELHTTATGTVRKNRKGLPRPSINARLHNKEVSERRKGPLLCVTYQDGSRKPVLLSTAVSAGYEDVPRRRGEPIERPKCVALYNKKMGGVDLGDAQLLMYLSERRTMKWSTKAPTGCAAVIYERWGMTKPYAVRKPSSLRSTLARLENFGMDFEDGMWAVWGAVRAVFPTCSRKGCAFHLTQAIYRKIQRIAGLLREGGAYELMRKLMVLHFLPAEHIPRAFEELRELTDNLLISELTAYMEQEWFNNSVWSVEEWSVYFQRVRTNNDTEGYHTRLNKKAQHSLPFYLLVDLLHEESRYVSLQAKLVIMNRLTRYRRKP
ncbi:hypothetical protein Bbelb_035370 [Branchiostoma belcheri]|nr:hypothetical protein Bbelb_035370 [Branchiostoma belcheri]